MKRVVSIAIALIMALGVFAIPAPTYAATKAPGKVAAKTLKVTPTATSLKFAWGKAKTGKKVLKTTSYQIKYTVQIKQENGKWKTTVKNKLLKKGRVNYHVYKGTKGNTYKVTLNVRGYNGTKFGSWTTAKTFTKTIPVFTPKYENFNPGLGQVGKNRSLTKPGYLNTQAVVFDKNTGVDGYNFAMASDGNTGVEVIHFKMDANDNITQVGSVHYASPGEKGSNSTRTTTYGIGHANDGCMYKNGNKKYMFVAISGGTEETFTDSDGNKGQKMGYIDMDEYAQAEAINNPNNTSEDEGVDPTAGGDGSDQQTSANQDDFAKVHSVAIKVNKGVTLSSTLAKCKFSGISYTGMRDVSGTKRPVFAIKDGRTFYAAYATFANGRPTLTIFDSARIVKPTFTINKVKVDAATQDMAYHGGFLYITYSCKNSGEQTRFMITRIKYADLFKDAYGDLRQPQTVTKNITEKSGEKLAKHIPESIFFKSMAEKGNFYLSVNRGTTATQASDIDAVLKSSVQY